MTDAPDEGTGDPDTPGARGSEGPAASPDRPYRGTDEAAAVARFGPGPARFWPDVPAPRLPGPPVLRGSTAPPPASISTSHTPAGRADVVVPERSLPARRADLAGCSWVRTAGLVRRAVTVVVGWSARGVVAAVDAVGGAAKGVLALVSG